MFQVVLELRQFVNVIMHFLQAPYFHYCVQAGLKCGFIKVFGNKINKSKARRSEEARIRILKTKIKFLPKIFIGQVLSYIKNVTKNETENEKI